MSLNSSKINKFSHRTIENPKEIKEGYEKLFC